MLIVISGGTGPIGRALTADYARGGHQVAILSRAPEKYRSDFPEQVSLVRWDGRTLDVWSDVVEGADVVFNLAGENIAGDKFFPDRWSEAKKQRIIDSRVDPGEVLAEAIAAATNRPSLFIQASGVNFYGTGGNKILTEQAPSGNDFLAGVCREWERATDRVEELGVSRAIVRIGLMLSSESGPLPRLLFPVKLYGGGYIGDGEIYYSWIHKTDVIRALHFVVENRQAVGPINLVAPNPVTKREFSKAIGRAMNRPSWFPVPAIAMRFSLGEVSTLVLDGQRAIPQKLIDLGFEFQYSSVDSALQDLIN